MPNLDPVVFLSPSSIGTAIEVTVASLASPTELNSLSAAQGDLVITRTTAAGTDDCVIYYADTTSDAQSLPYIVTTATAGVKFIAIAGRYRNATNAISALTASRVVATDASKNLDTPATVTTGQAWAFTSTVSVVDGNFTVTGSSDATKTLKFEVDGQSAGADLTLNVGAQTADRTLNFPVLTATATLAALEETQTFTGAKTFSAITTVSNSTAATAGNAGALVVTGGVAIGKEFWASARSRIAVSGDSAQLGIQRTGTSSGLVYWGATGDRDSANTFDRATVYGTALGRRIEFTIFDSADPTIEAVGGPTGFRFTNTASATSTTSGSVIVGNGTAATTVGIGGGNVRAGAGITSISPTAGVGYATGAGGTVAQGSGSGKATGVTLNTVCGTITMDGANLNADTTVAFTFTNSAIAATDLVVIQHSSVGTLGGYNFAVTPAGGSATVSVRNVTPGNLAEAIVLRFAIIKAVTA